MEKPIMEYPKKKKHERELHKVNETQTLGSADKRNPSQCKIKYMPFQKKSQ